MSAVPAHLRLTPIEELWALPLGIEPHTQPLETRPLTQPLAGSADTHDPREALGPREALETAALPALQRPPCMVSFSGGVDSSIVLALAAAVARRERLPAPVPITNRFAAVETTHENDWQESVVTHLKLDDWVRLDWEDELDVLGPFATGVLRRHGLLFPFNSFFHQPMLERAAGGSLLTGIGGDELFTRLSRPVAARLLYERHRPRRSELRRLAFELSPRPLRAAVDTWRNKFFDQFRWIHAPQRRELRHTSVAWQSRKPLRDDRSLLEWWWPSRMLQCGLASMRALAEDCDVMVAHPLADPAVLRAFARAGGPLGIGGGSRRRGAKQLVADLLPGEILERRDKTIFDGVFWNQHSRAFAAQWDGSGVDPELVDVDALRAEWSKESPFPQTFILLQRAWLRAAVPAAAG